MQTLKEIYSKFEKYVKSYDPKVQIIDDDYNFKAVLNAEKSAISVEELPFPTRITFILDKDNFGITVVLQSEISKGRKLTADYFLDVISTVDTDEIKSYGELKSKLSHVIYKLYGNLTSDAEYINALKKLS